MTSTQTTPTAGSMLREATSLVCFMPLYGPPVVFLAAPWLFLGLFLSGPFVLVLTVVLTLLAAMALVGAVAALLATPYLIVRKLRTASIARPAAASVSVELRRVVA